MEKKHLFGWPASFWLLLLACLWTLIRPVLYLYIIPKRALFVDLPFASGGGLSTVSNITASLFLITLFGLVAAVALYAHKGRWRYWAVGTFMLNIMAFWYWFHLVGEALSLPPGTDY